MSVSTTSGFNKGHVIAAIVLSVVGFLVYTGHGAHLMGFFPYLLILACPLMHVFMHHGHYHEGHAQHGGEGCCGGSSEKPTDSADRPQGDNTPHQGGQP